MKKTQGLDSNESTSEMIWTFTANSAEDLSRVRESIPDRCKPTTAGELFQMRFLLEALALTEVPEFPFTVRHTGEDSIPDFQLDSGSKKFAVELTRVTSQNLEHARSLQQDLPTPPSHFALSDLCSPEGFAQRLKSCHDEWASFVSGKLCKECRDWLSKWNKKDKVPVVMKEHMIATMNAIIDGPSIAGDARWQHANPRPELFQATELFQTEFPCEETPHDRKSWLEAAFWEFFAVPINGTLMVTPFIRQDDSRLKRFEVFQRGFIVPAMPVGPTLEEEHAIWVKHVSRELRDKTVIRSGPKFQHGDEDWLVMWDRLGTAGWQLLERAKAITELLRSFWKHDWFSRVFLQDDHFAWQLLFTPKSTTILPGPNPISLPGSEPHCNPRTTAKPRQTDRI